MMNKTVVIFNAPIGAGKDVSADYLHEYFQSGQRLSFKEALYEDTAEYFDIDVNDFIEYHSDRSLKEVPSLMFPKHGRNSLLQMLYTIWYVIGTVINNRYLMSLGYYSSREALIHVSEDIMKPKYGQDYYGCKFLEKVESSPERYVFASDGGFFRELTPLLDNGYNVHIVKLERSGATFEGDSRTLLNEDDFKDYSNIKFTTISNNGSLDDLYDNIREFAFDLVLNTTKEFYGWIEYGGGNMKEIQSEYEIVET